MWHHVEGIAIAVLIAAAVVGPILCFSWLRQRRKKTMIRMHRQAIQRYFDQRGEDLLDARWQRFLRPRELALTMEDAIFDVTFVDRKGREHRATCRSDRAGVFLADDESE